jgi:beta-glucosidase
VARPVRELKGFQRITLQPGEKKAVIFEVPMSALAFYDRAMQIVVEPGMVDVMVGSSSADIRASGELEISGSVTPVERTYTTQVEVRTLS